jgi:hypothetical protein
MKLKSYIRREFMHPQPKASPRTKALQPTFDHGLKSKDR